MDEVVSCRSEANVGQVAEHEEVGSEEEDGEERPAVVEMLVGDDGEDEEGGFLDSEEDGWLGEHRRFYTRSPWNSVVRGWTNCIIRAVRRTEERQIRFKDFLCITT